MKIYILYNSNLQSNLKIYYNNKILYINIYKTLFSKSIKVEIFTDYYYSPIQYYNFRSFNEDEIIDTILSEL